MYNFVTTIGLELVFVSTSVVLMWSAMKNTCELRAFNLLIERSIAARGGTSKKQDESDSCKYLNLFYWAFAALLAILSLGELVVSVNGLVAALIGSIILIIMWVGTVAFSYRFNKEVTI